MREILSGLLRRHFGRDVVVFSLDNVHGGCINTCYHVHSSAGEFFVKTNAADAFSGMFTCEAQGLAALREACPDSVPAVIFHTESRGSQFLFLEWLREGNTAKDFAAQLARDLVIIHRTTSESFGWKRDNYIGSIAQHNTPTDQWGEFFVLHRLQPMVRKAVDAKIMAPLLAGRIERSYTILASVFPEEPPSLLHGDLWRGNIRRGTDGYARLIDPAVYFGHREMDLAMMELFGGFDPAIKEEYLAIFPLAPGHEERRDICNLYPLLVHANLFGPGYLSDIEMIVKRFT